MQLLFSARSRTHPVPPVSAGAMASMVASIYLSSLPVHGQAGFQGLGYLPGSAGWDSHVSAVSADGSVIVGWDRFDDHFEAFRWTEVAGMKSLGTFGGDSDSYATGVSADGSVVVGLVWTFDDDGTQEAVSSCWDGCKVPCQEPTPLKRLAYRQMGRP